MLTTLSFWNMSANLKEISDPKENLKEPAFVALDGVLNKNRMTQVRREIGIIADRSHNENLISDEAYDGYRQLAEGREEHEISAEMLENTRRFAKEHEQKAIRINAKIQNAIRQGYASETDEEFLMEKLIVENIKFAGQASEVEALIDQKLARMKKDKERYDKLAEHPLIREEGRLTFDGSNKIDFPDAEEFLEMTVPERRELLEKLEEALPKAEAYAEEQEEKGAEKRIGSYTKKLDNAVQAKIIGEHTYNEFLGEFMQLDAKEQERWDREFDSQMKRYRTLWTQIRSTLKDEALEGMEGMLDESGYSEIFKAYGNVKNSESQRLRSGYAEALEDYKRAGVIGRHTANEFVRWMNERDLADQYEAEGRLPGEMARYEKLWEDIEELPKKQREFLRSQIDVWGYTELKSQYKMFQEGEGLPSEGAQMAEVSLSRLQSKEVIDAITETDEILTEQGTGRRGAFIGILGRMFSKVNRDAFDATSFETELRKRTIRVNPDMKRDLKGRGADDEVDFEQIEDDTEVLEEAGSATVSEGLGFIQVESAANESGASRQTQVTVNEGDGMDRLLAEDSKNSYQAGETGGSDDLSLAVYTKGGRTVELDLNEVRVLQDFLKKKEVEKLDKAA